MRLNKTEAREILREEFFRDFSKELRRAMNIDSPELINWLWRFQNDHPQVAAVLGGELHQARHSLLERYIGPTC